MRLCGITDYATAPDRYRQQMGGDSPTNSPARSTISELSAQFRADVGGRVIDSGYSQLSDVARARSADHTLAWLEQTKDQNNAAYAASTDPNTRAALLASTAQAIAAARNTNAISESKAYEFGRQAAVEAVVGWADNQPPVQAAQFWNPPGSGVAPPALAPSIATHIVSATADGAAAGLPADYLPKLAAVESRNNPAAVNPKTGAAGLYGVMPATAQAWGITNVHDVADSTQGVIRGSLQNQAAFQKAVGRAPTGPELYLTHQQGSAGGPALVLADPSVRAVDVLKQVYTKAGKANPGLWASSAILNNGGNLNMTAGQFTGWVERQYENTAAPAASGEAQAGATASAATQAATGATGAPAPANDLTGPSGASGQPQQLTFANTNSPADLVPADLRAQQYREATRPNPAPAGPARPRRAGPGAAAEAARRFGRFKLSVPDAGPRRGPDQAGRRSRRHVEGP